MVNINYGLIGALLFCFTFWGIIIVLVVPRILH